MNKKNTLFGLDAKSYEHDFDKAALKTMRALPGFDTVVNFFLNWTYIKWHVIELQGSNFLVTRESCPELYELVHDVADTLDVRPLPRFYTQWGYNINGYTTGYKEDTLLVLNSGTVDLLEEDELRFVAGHEMGHVKSGHVIYHTMGELFNNAIGQIPLVSSLTTPIYYALMYWIRMSEFTADRAGLLACQNIDAAVSAIIKMSGLPIKYFEKMDKASFIKQANEFKNSFSGFTDKAIKTITIASSSHPWTVLRAAELISWYDSDNYRQLVETKTSIECSVCRQQIPADAKKCPFCGNKDL
ncbi:M48 family metalloprotease [uncultured Bacteroides sp.]|uniref:M48 family metalloprotease n=1 Tax=uncultured Bacteroides sp. TaxID=162156 RepID=UPI0027D93541|nr:M48 family metalloprotease [uncultured Bacteroides sp.]